MKVLYITDLHGVESKYNQVLEIALSSRVDLIINGGDMLPTRPNFFIQDTFIEEFLNPYFNTINSHDIYYLFIPGNDDLKIHDDLLKNVADRYPKILYLQERLHKINDFEFIGMNWVTDLPFGLKDRARMDTEDFLFPRQIGKPVFSTKDGFEVIEDWFSYAKTLPTLQEELEKLVKPINMKNTVYVLHMPPSDVSLDVCSDARRVGSKAIYEFIKKHQPLLTLHGHIHESPQMTNKWHNTIGKTISIQPGQSNHYEKYLAYVLIDLETLAMERKVFHQ
ncbi:MAG: hypothetical protein BAJALOKI1v1_400016 [Promethearchaeota archaeon]|nr:MAG: hypothetical protein BAJALOKI1v1_400016 [Candidatus Lokiarchaeota archaeon]